MKRNANDGFTLVELSIVIVIVGLMVAGVTAGNSLVKQARIRQALTQVTNYSMVINTFKLSYNSLPGDFPRAFDLWGAAASCTNSIATSSNPGGCNGNGDKTIDWDGEEQRLWQHLNLSKLLPITYSGVQGTNRFNPRSTPADVPTFLSESGAVGFVCAGNTAPRQNRLEFNGQDSITPNNFNVATLRGTTALSIDGKVDDGRPNTGKIRSTTAELPEGRTRNGSPAVNLTCDNGTAYDITQNEATCGLLSYF